VEQPEPPPPTGPEGGPVAPRNRLVLIGAVVVLAIVAAVAAWLVIDHRDSSSSAPTTTSVAKTGPVVLSAPGLNTLAAAVGQPIYWAGPQPKMYYELTRTTDGKVYVRYLPPGVTAGAPSAAYLTVATYPFPGAYEALREVADGREKPVAGGGIALVDGSHPQSVYVAFPGVDYQVEVYDPSPQRARAAALSGNVKPVA
jgi:hypothetical protein